jgi:hypothetical protein
MILVILAIWLGYKKAKATGRNPYLWAFISAAAFIGAQLLAGFIIGATVELATTLRGTSSYGWLSNNFGILNVVGLVSGFVALWIVFRYLDRVREQPIVDSPPPPPRFGD